MSASYMVDLGQATEKRQSVAVGSGSDLLVGQIVDLLNANAWTNVWVQGAFGSGAIEVRVQTSDLTTSGSFTDPTSGLPHLDFPGGLLSGGRFIANSGLWPSGNVDLSAPVNNAPLFCSGGLQAAGFQRPHRYARLIHNSGPFPNWCAAGFLGQKKTTGSGVGFSYSPSSGSVSV